MISYRCYIKQEVQLEQQHLFVFIDEERITFSLGKGINTCSSKRPGRSTAASIASMRFVAYPNHCQPFFFVLFGQL